MIPEISILTFILGDGELLRTPSVVNPNAEYICITDNSNLRSDTWTCIFDESLTMIPNLRQRMAYIKYNPFKYATGKHVVVIDGSFEIGNDFSHISRIMSTHEIALRTHPYRTSLVDEIDVWKQCRGLPEETYNKFQSAFNKCGYGDYRGLFETSTLILNRTARTEDLLAMTREACSYFGTSDGTWCMTNQCPFTFVINTKMSSMDVYGFYDIRNVVKCKHKTATRVSRVPLKTTYMFNSPYYPHFIP